MLEERAIEEEALAKKREQREQAECPTVGVSPGVILCFSSPFSPCSTRFELFRVDALEPRGVFV